MKNLVESLHMILMQTRYLEILTQMYHWNHKSPNFVQMHELFGNQYKTFFEYRDIIGEMIRKLSYFVNFSKISFKETEEFEEKDPLKQIENLIQNNKKLEISLKEGIYLAKKFNESAIENKLSDFLDLVQKNIWFLKSCKQ